MGREADPVRSGRALALTNHFEFDSNGGTITTSLLPSSLESSSSQLKGSLSRVRAHVKAACCRLCIGRC